MEDIHHDADDPNDPATMTDASSLEKNASVTPTVADDERELARMGYKQELK